MLSPNNTNQPNIKSKNHTIDVSYKKKSIKFLSPDIGITIESRDQNESPKSILGSKVVGDTLFLLRKSLNPTENGFQLIKISIDESGELSTPLIASMPVKHAVGSDMGYKAIVCHSNLTDFDPIFSEDKRVVIGLAVNSNQGEMSLNRGINGLKDKNCMLVGKVDPRFINKEGLFWQPLKQNT